jgi:hypothetical protein
VALLNEEQAEAHRLLKFQLSLNCANANSKLGKHDKTVYHATEVIRFE